MHQRLPVLCVPVLCVPVLCVPVLRVPVLRVPVLRARVKLAGGLVSLALVSGCVAPQAPAVGHDVAAGLRTSFDSHVPDFARRPYVPFNRQDAVAIALREWRLFGQPVDDDPPGTRPEPPADQKPERMPGLWERVGEYWWLGLDADNADSAWTGKHDGDGIEFPARQDGSFAWSAAFISYVMRIAGAGSHFPYAASHSDYINIAAQMKQNQTAGYAIVAEPPELYPPKLGDVICTGRGRAAGLKYADLPTGKFAGHCDIVVAVHAGELSVLGGNVDDAVTMKHIPVTGEGLIATPDGMPVDTRYPWFVVLRVMYDMDTEPSSAAVSIR